MIVFFVRFLIIFRFVLILFVSIIPSVLFSSFFDYHFVYFDFVLRSESEALGPCALAFIIRLLIPNHYLGMFLGTIIPLRVGYVIP